MATVDTDACAMGKYRGVAHSLLCHVCNEEEHKPGQRARRSNDQNASTSLRRSNETTRHLSIAK
jgi:hypothetical protein